MPSEPQLVYVWLWMPGAISPVVAGVLGPRPEGGVRFAYGQSYLQREDCISLYEPELPLRRGWQSPGGIDLPGCINDAAPDAWGRRVIAARLLGRGDRDEDLGTLTSFVESGSDRIGALDFQQSPATYTARPYDEAPLADLMRVAELVEEGAPLPPALDQALLHGTSIGGARPKAILREGGRNLIAKFSSSTDQYKVVKGEYIAMDLARLAGLDVARVKIEAVLGRDVLLIERFDRPRDGTRLAMVTAKTTLGLYGWQTARYASYAALADHVREAFVEADSSLRELFARIAFNILTGNTDDHARNHSAFWDGKRLRLTPAYDICPQPRSGGEATQAMEIGPGDRRSALAACVEHAHIFHLDETAARSIIDEQVETIVANWSAVCDAGRLGELDRGYFWGRQFLNRYAFEGYGTWPLR